MNTAKTDYIEIKDVQYDSKYKLRLVFNDGKKGVYLVRVIFQNNKSVVKKLLIK